MGGIAALQWFEQSKLDYAGLSDKLFLKRDDQIVLSVFIPVIAAGMPHRPAIEVIMNNIDQAALLLSQKSQEELRQLLSLLGTGLGRLMMSGLWQNWQQTSRQSVDKTLGDWREHHLQLMQVAYVGLHQIVIGGVYAEANSWQAIGYPGPPELFL